MLYYTQGTSPMSDAEWDQKYNELSRLEKESGIVFARLPYWCASARSHSAPSPLTGISTAYGSMDKVQSKEELLAWLERTQKLHAQLCDGVKRPCPRSGTRSNTSWTA